MTTHRDIDYDPEGMGRSMDREADSMSYLQFYREAVQNEFEAGAKRVVIDGYSSPHGLLARVSGDGCGMSATTLKTYLATIGKTTKNNNVNYGLGARVASLPFNPAGVTFASRTTEGASRITLFKNPENGHYAIKSWPVTEQDEDGEVFSTLREILPVGDELSNVRGPTGTAVILHGDGERPTYDTSTAYAIHNFLTKRYLRFPDGVSVVVDHNGSKLSVVPIGDVLRAHAIHEGRVPFSGVSGLSGTMFWWTLPKKEDMHVRVNGHNDIGSGVGLVLVDEIFQYDTRYLTDFGILYKGTQSRVVILISVVEAKMDNARSIVTYPGTKQTPWKALGAYFADHMPAAIADLLAANAPPPEAVFTDEAARRLDSEWMRHIKPVPTINPRRPGLRIVGDDAGDGLPPGTSHPDGPGPGPGPRERPRLAAHRRTGGDANPGRTELRIVTPKVVFTPPEEMPDGHEHIAYFEATNTVLISVAMPPYVREVQRWMDRTGHARAVVESAVRGAYSIEYAATIIDVNGQRRTGLAPERIDGMKSDDALYAKALGCQSLTQMIETFLRAAARSA
jgi:hypothetical protein